ncbi:hypothetical protein [Streptomyces sp. 2231.1]|uniref:hypothetical protein n=1 Tax=Streptomyces sp. 2231.1 TaxID=1855347 RepID=UPI000A639DE9|nr:hypothetical protein [Streptomyces sp. 2231.1]
MPARDRSPGCSWAVAFSADAFPVGGSWAVAFSAGALPVGGSWALAFSARGFLAGAASPGRFSAAALSSGVVLARGFFAAVREAAVRAGVPSAAVLSATPVLSSKGLVLAAAFPACFFPAVFRSSACAVTVARADPRTALFFAVAAVSFAAVLGAPARVPFFSAPEAAAPLGRLVAGCSTAVFFATMAAAPSHIVISHANRAGTINRLESRGNGAHRPIRPPAPPAQRACIRCAQLPAG